MKIIHDAKTGETRMEECTEDQDEYLPPELTDIEKLKVRTAATEDAIIAILDIMMGGMF